MLYRKIEPLIEAHLRSGSDKILLVDEPVRWARPISSVMWKKSCFPT